jgi:hypothetical protein
MAGLQVLLIAFVKKPTKGRRIEPEILQPVPITVASSESQRAGQAVRVLQEPSYLWIITERVQLGVGLRHHT